MSLYIQLMETTGRGIDELMIMKNKLLKINSSLRSSMTTHGARPENTSSRERNLKTSIFFLYNKKNINKYK